MLRNLSGEPQLFLEEFEVPPVLAFDLPGEVGAIVPEVGLSALEGAAPCRMFIQGVVWDLPLFKASGPEAVIQFIEMAVLWGLGEINGCHQAVAIAVAPARRKFKIDIPKGSNDQAGLGISHADVFYGDHRQPLPQLGFQIGDH